MKPIPVSHLKAGLTFSEPVYMEGNHLFAAAGIPIREKDIQRIREWGVRLVFCDGQAVESDAPVSKVKSDAVLPVGTDVYRNYLDAIRRMTSIFEDITTGFSVDQRAVNGVVADLLKGILKERSLMIGYILGGDIQGQEQGKNAVNTAILSTLVSLSLNFSQFRLSQIIAGALLHDAGMSLLPGELLDKRGGLSEAELQTMRTHPRKSYEIAKELRYPEEVGAIVLQHHENWDGLGYPKGKMGVDIDTGARIVSVCDAFEAMISQKPYRNPMGGYQAVRNLLADNSRRFDPEILAIFVKVMGLYPIGSVVMLNNGITGRVLDTQEHSPLRPKVRVLADAAGKFYPKNSGRIIDLIDERTLFISREMDLRELMMKFGEI
jgi:HD-GYP domain-containing protein (c-di-GMP phosphodiesterase class II)